MEMSPEQAARKLAEEMHPLQTVEHVTFSPANGGTYIITLRIQVDLPASRVERYRDSWSKPGPRISVPPPGPKFMSLESAARKLAKEQYPGQTVSNVTYSPDGEGFYTVTMSGGEQIVLTAEQALIYRDAHPLRGNGATPQ